MVKNNFSIPPLQLRIGINQFQIEITIITIFNLKLINIILMLKTKNNPETEIRTNKMATYIRLTFNLKLINQFKTRS